MKNLLVLGPALRARSTGEDARKPELPYHECRRTSLIQLRKGLDPFFPHYPLFSASQYGAAVCQFLNLGCRVKE